MSTAAKSLKHCQTKLWQPTWRCCESKTLIQTKIYLTLSTIFDEGFRFSMFYRLRFVLLKFGTCWIFGSSLNLNLQLEKIITLDWYQSLFDRTIVFEMMKLKVSFWRSGNFLLSPLNTKRYWKVFVKLGFLGKIFLTARRKFQHSIESFFY